MNSCASQLNLPGPLMAREAANRPVTRGLLNYQEHLRNTRARDNEGFRLRQQHGRLIQQRLQRN